MRDDRRAAALTARAAKDHDTAVSHWRTLLDRAPDDWALALELKRDLKAGWHYPDSDPRFRRAARRLPDAEWLAHYSALYAFHGSDLDTIDTRARQLLAKHPGEHRLHAIIGDAARQRRDWTTAIQAFEAAKEIDPTNPEYPTKAAAARLYARLAETPWHNAEPNAAQTYSAQTYGVWVVNLDRNTERMVEIERQLAGTPVPITRVPAVEGKRLPGAAVQRLTGDPRAPRGTLGCFLSHLWLWETFLAGPDDHALVLEDDAIPLLNLPPTLAGLGLPATFDLCWVNDRMEPRPTEPQNNPTTATGFTTTPMPDAMAAYHPDDNAAGTDGYIISRQGAKTLLQWANEDGMADDIDWRLVAWSLGPADIARLATPSVARDNMARLQPSIRRKERLDAHVLHPALIRTVGVSSDREDDNRLTEKIVTPGPVP